jgi:hypothetical protein
MLRLVVLILGVLVLVAGVFTYTHDAPYAALWLLAVGGVTTVGTVFERIRYKPILPDTPGFGWVGTDERFVDPETGKAVDVFYHPASGERRYVSRETN